MSFNLGSQLSNFGPHVISGLLIFQEEEGSNLLKPLSDETDEDLELARAIQMSLKDQEQRNQVRSLPYPTRLRPSPPCFT